MFKASRTASMGLNMLTLSDPAKRRPLEIEKLLKVARDISSLPLYGKLILVEFDKDTNSFVEWFDENPFKDG
ncbi:MAG: hypothetical protein HXS54_16330 [Theionarchaea archaeon]|nr:hypothetical protein [Theionarchaea archaeon]